MSTLTYADRDLVAPEAAKTKPARPSIWARLFNALVEAQQRRANREIARFLATRGPLTDETEREIMRGLQRGGTWLG